MDFCVAYSAEDAARLGFEAIVIEDACRGIGFPVGEGETSISVAKRRLEALNVKFVTAELAVNNLNSD